MEDRPEWDVQFVLKYLTSGPRTRRGPKILVLRASRRFKCQAMAKWCKAPNGPTTTHAASADEVPIRLHCTRNVIVRPTHQHVFVSNPQTLREAGPAKKHRIGLRLDEPGLAKKAGLALKEKMVDTNQFLRANLISCDKVLGNPRSGVTYSRLMLWGASRNCVIECL